MSAGRMACPECGAENPSGTKFCEGCGMMFVAKRDGDEAAEEPSTEAVEPRRPTRRSSAGARAARDPERAERVAIHRKLEKARRTLRGVRVLYVLNAVLLSAVAILNLWVWASVGSTEEHDLGILALILVPMALFAIVGAIAFYANPFVFTLVLACLSTLEVALVMAEGDLPMFKIVITVMLWCAVPITWSVEKLRRDYPDFVDTSKIQGKRKRSDAPTSAAYARAELRRAEQRRASMRTAAIVVGALVAVVGGVIAWKASGRGASDGGEVQAAGRRDYSPDELAAMGAELRGRAQAFRRAILASDLAQVEGMFLPARRESMWSKTERALMRRGWDRQAPELGEANGDDDTPQPSMHEVWFRFDSDDGSGELRTHWIWRDDRWQIFRLGIRRD